MALVFCLNFQLPLSSAINPAQDSLTLVLFGAYEVEGSCIMVYKKK